MFSALTRRHGAAWMTDAWYRRAWFVWPQAVGLSLIVFLLATPPQPPLGVISWVHPSDVKGRLNALSVLWQQAKTDPAAQSLLREKAEAGDAFAQFFMGNLFDPTLVPDHTSAEGARQAEDWYRRSAEQNFALAQANLGTLLAHQRFDMPANYPEAYGWLDKASAHVPSAQRELGLMFLLGHGVPVDAAKGIDLLRQAADHGDAGAQLGMADALDNGRYGLVADHREAVEFLQKAAMHNNVRAQRELAIHLRDGQGVPVDPGKAAYWFKRAADAGDAYARAQAATPSVSPPSDISPFSFAPIH